MPVSYNTADVLLFFFLTEIPCVILSTAVSNTVYRIRVSKGVVLCIKKKKKTDWSLNGIRLSGFGYDWIYEM